MRELSEDEKARRAQMLLRIYDADISFEEALAQAFDIGRSEAAKECIVMTCAAIAYGCDCRQTIRDYFAIES